MNSYSSHALTWRKARRTLNSGTCVRDASWTHLKKKFAKYMRVSLHQVPTRDGGGGSGQDQREGNGNEDPDPNNSKKWRDLLAFVAVITACACLKIFGHVPDESLAEYGTVVAAVYAVWRSGK